MSHKHDMDVAPPHRSWTARWSVLIVTVMTGLVTAACIGALYYADDQGRRTIEAQEREAVDDELDYFQTLREKEGAEALQRSVARRALTEGRGKHKDYALLSANGGLVAGNLVAWPRDLPPESQAWRIAHDPADNGPIHVAARRLLDGETVLVGRDDDALNAFRNDLVGAAWVAVAVVAVTCLGIGIAVTAVMLRRTERLSSLAARVADGDFSARSEMDRDSGPFGQIARAQNIMLNRIESLVTGLTAVTDSLAHDLRTPLSRARQRVEQGLLADQLDQKQQALELALAELNNMSATFTALIDVARADGGLSRKSMEQVDLASIARDVYDLFEPLAEEKGVQIRLQAEEPEALLGHRALLMQAASNLVHNALKYAPRGGRVDIALIPSEALVEFIVADNGPGIAAADHELVRQRFKRADAHNPEGLGLGLAIVDACARLHRGVLLLEDNQPGLRARLALSRT